MLEATRDGAPLQMQFSLAMFICDFGSLAESRSRKYVIALFLLPPNTGPPPRKHPEAEPEKQSFKKRKCESSAWRMLECLNGFVRR